MNLLQEIQSAQRKTRVELDSFGGRGCQQVLEAMTPEAQAAWKATKLPNELLVGRVSDIQVYADKCGIRLPTV